MAPSIIWSDSEMSVFAKKCPCLWLLLVLCLCGSVEVIQDALHVLKGGPVLRFVLPAGHHDLVQLSGTVVGPRHPVATLYRGHHLSFSHTWGQQQTCRCECRKHKLKLTSERLHSIVAEKRKETLWERREERGYSSHINNNSFTNRDMNINDTKSIIVIIMIII